jgi:hypothetical protein
MLAKTSSRWELRLSNHVSRCSICGTALEGQEPGIEPRGLCRIGANLWTRIMSCAAPCTRVA